MRDYKNPGNGTFSDDDDDSDDFQATKRANSRTKSRQSSVTGSKDVEMLIGEIAGDKNKKDKDAKMLAIVFVAMVFVGLGNKVFQKLMTIPMRNYPNFLNLLTTFVYLPTSFAYIIPSIKSGRIPKEQAEMSKKPFFIMGFLDAIAGIMQVFAATYLPGPLLILLSQAAIPMSMAITRYLLKQKYTIFQYAGALVVGAGIVVVLAPTLSGSGSVLWAFVMIISTIPMALSSVYKEIALGETELDPIFLNGWICVFQFLFSLVMCVPASLTSEPPVPVNELPENIYDGLKCFGGVDTVTCPADADISDCSPDDCSSSTWLVSVYLIFNQAYNLLIILIIKYGSSNLLFMALTIMVPLGNFAFTLPFVPQHAPLHTTDVIGLVVISGGLVCYRFGTQIIKNHYGGKLCGYQLVSDEDEDEKDAEGADLSNPLLSKDYLYDDGEAEGPADEDTDSRYSVSKVAKKGPNDRESEGGVTLNEANVI